MDTLSAEVILAHIDEAERLLEELSRLETGRCYRDMIDLKRDSLKMK